MYSTIYISNTEIRVPNRILSCGLDPNTTRTQYQYYCTNTTTQHAGGATTNINTAHSDANAIKNNYKSHICKQTSVRQLQIDYQQRLAVRKIQFCASVKCELFILGALCVQFSHGSVSVYILQHHEAEAPTIKLSGGVGWQIFSSTITEFGNMMIIIITHRPTTAHHLPNLKKVLKEVKRSSEESVSCLLIVTSAVHFT